MILLLISVGGLLSVVTGGDKQGEEHTWCYILEVAVAVAVLQSVNRCI